MQNLWSFISNILYTRTHSTKTIRLLRRNMAAAVIINFCHNPVCTNYPFHGLQNIRKIIEKDHCNDDCARLQLELMIHVSKMNLSGIRSAHYLGKFERMSFYNPTEESYWSKKWLDLAHKIVSNEIVSFHIRGV